MPWSKTLTCAKARLVMRQFVHGSGLTGATQRRSDRASNAPMQYLAAKFKLGDKSDLDPASYDNIGQLLPQR